MNRADALTKIMRATQTDRGIRSAITGERRWTWSDEDERKAQELVRSLEALGLITLDQERPMSAAVRSKFVLGNFIRDNLDVLPGMSGHDIGKALVLRLQEHGLDVKWTIDR